MRGLCLLTAKPMVYAANVAEDDLADPGSNRHVVALQRKAEEEGSSVVVMSAQVRAGARVQTCGCAVCMVVMSAQERVGPQVQTCGCA